MELQELLKILHVYTYVGGNTYAEIRNPSRADRNAFSWNIGQCCTCPGSHTGSAGRSATASRNAVIMMAQNPDKQIAHMTAKLNLTADQQAQIKPILQDRNTQMMALHSDTTLAGPDKMAKMKSINQDTHAKIEAVLTDEQKKQWAEMQAQQREKMQQHMQEHGGGMGMDPPPPPPPAQ